MDLYQAFLDLPVAGSPVDFSAIPLSESRLDFLAKTEDGSPVFLLHDSSTTTYTPNIELKYVSAHFHSTCRVTTANGSVEAQYAVVSCNASTSELFEIFIRCFAASIEGLQIDAETNQLRASIQRLLELFRSLSSPSTREVTGLWAELFVIERSGNIAQALKAWHSDQFERFDFSWPDKLIEVKATVNELRQHEFALEQLQPPAGSNGYVVSLLLQPLSGGVGVLDLAKRIESSLTGNPELKRKLWENITRSLGLDFSNRLDRRFDLTFAQRNLALYFMKDIPAPALPSDHRVTSIRFRADLSNMQSSVDVESDDLLLGLFS